MDWETLQYYPDAKPGQCRIHRVPEVFCDLANLEYPLAEYRKIEQKMVRVPRDAVPKEKDTAHAPGQIDPPGGGSAESREEAAAPGVDRPESEMPQGLDWVGMFGAGPQEDMRGKGEVLPDGRVVRAWKGSSRVPGIDPDVWARLYTTKEKRALIEAYENT